MPIITNWTSMLETNPEQIVAEDITSFFLKKAVSDLGKKRNFSGSDTNLQIYTRSFLLRYLGASRDLIADNQGFSFAMISYPQKEDAVKHGNRRTWETKDVELRIKDRQV